MPDREKREMIDKRIDREKVLCELKQLAGRKFNEFSKTASDALALLGAQQQIIYCKDCKNGGIDSSSYPQYWCSAHTEYVMPFDFCSHGRKKDESNSF